MTEKIGLEAVLIDRDFMAGFSRYMSSVSLMETGTVSAARKLTTQYVGLGNTVLSTAGKIGTALAAATAVAAVGMVKLGANTVKAASDMEEQMKGVQAVLGITNEELDDLSGLVIDLGIDPALKVSAVEAAQAIEMLARNGLDMSDIMGGAARNTVLLANSTGGTFAQSADVATDVMAIFNIEAKDMADAVDGITSVVVNSKFGIEDYAYALGQGGGVAAAVGVNFADFNATIAATSPLFDSGATAGTSLKVMLTRLVPASDSATDAMRELGIITEEGQNRFFDAEGNMRSMAEISGVLAEATADLTEEQKSQQLATIFGTNALRTAIGLASTGEEAFNALKDTMGNTDAEEAARIRMDNLAGAIEILSGIIETLKIRIGQALIPIVRQMTEAFSEFVASNADRVVAFFQGAVTFIENFVNALQDGMDPVSAFMETLVDFVPHDVVSKLWPIIWAIQDFIDVVATFVSEHAEAIKGAFAGIAAVLAGSVVASVLAGIAAAIAALISPIGLLIAAAAALGAAWSSNWRGIRDILTNVWTSTLKPALEDLWEWLSVNIPKALDAMSTAWGTVESFVREFFDSLSGGMTPLMALGEALDSFIPEDVMDKIWAVLIALQDFIDVVVSFVSEHAEAIKGAFMGIAAALAGSAIASVIAGIGAAIATLFSPIGLIIAAAAALGAAWNSNWMGIRDTLTAAWTETIQPKLQELWDWLVVTVPIAMETLRAFWSDTLWPAIQATIEFVWPIIKTIFDALAWYVSEYLPVFFTALKAVWDFIWPGIQAVLEFVWPIIQGIFDDLAWYVSVYLPAFFSALKAVWDFMWPGIQAVIEFVWPIIKAIFDGLAWYVSVYLPEFFGFFQGIWDVVWAGIQTAIEAVWPILVTIFELWVWYFTEFIPLAFSKLKTGWSELWEKVKFGLRAAWDVISVIFKAVKEAIEEKLVDAILTLREKMVEAWTVIRTAIETFWDGARGILESAKEAVDRLFDAIKGFGDWLSGKKFSFDFEIPDLPDWMTPGSDIPLHTSWKDFSRFLDTHTFVAQVDYGGFVPMAAAAQTTATPAPIIEVEGGTTTTENNFNLNVTSSESELTMRQNFRLMERMNRD